MLCFRLVCGFHSLVSNSYKKNKEIVTMFTKSTLKGQERNVHHCSLVGSTFWQRLNDYNSHIGHVPTLALAGGGSKSKKNWWGVGV